MRLIYTKTTEKLHKLYKAIKHKRSKCLESNEDPDICWLNFYVELTRLIKLNKKMLQQNNELTGRREEVLDNHINHALDNLKKYKSKVKRKYGKV